MNTHTPTHTHNLNPCPCDSGLPYARCCSPWHQGVQRGLAPTAQALMRSRYSAHVLQLGDYIQDTWHPSRRPAQPPVWEPGLRWLGLQILQHRQQDADHATVEFVARHKLAGRATRLHELSRFVREGGRWFYVDGDAG